MSQKIIFSGVGVIVLFGVGFFVASRFSPTPLPTSLDMSINPPPISALQNISSPTSVKLGKIPTGAEIVYHHDNFIYVMNGNGDNITQITFEHPRNYEHQAVSYDHRYVVANEQLPNPRGDPGGHSRLWLFDLEKGTETQLLPKFMTAGNGGVAWDKNGFIYVAAKDTNPYSNPKTPQEFMANAGANDIYRVKFDGTGVQRITNTPDFGEADVSVSQDGTLIVASGLDIAKNVYSIIVANSDGTNWHALTSYKLSAHASISDPEISPDNKYVVFDKVDTDVPPNFPNNPDANTAYDLWLMHIDGNAPVRLTKPGSISIVPNWQLPGDLISYMEINEKENYNGASIVSATGGADQTGKRIKQGAETPKWIPK